MSHIEIIYSNKYGRVEVVVDKEDAHLLKGNKWTIWGTTRHSGLYVTRNIKVGHKRLHRLILNAPDDKVVDHINGNPLDNRKENLRLTTQGGNNKNSSKRKNAKTSGFKGVHYSAAEKNFKAQIQLNGKRISLGSYKSEEEAAIAYNLGALEFHGEFAKINDWEESK